MLKIKLKQLGKKHQRTYRIIVGEARSKANGSFVDDIGFYTPQTKTLDVNQEKLAKWLKDGAQLTEGVDKLLNPDKFPKKVKKVTAEAKTEA
ncbi:MAG TPA: 30S ribosomal protein S16 [Patescibacteria group bacterium]